MQRICAVVLTYNRKAILHDCLKAITAQSVRCDRIIVVDNASTDGTFDMLVETWSEEADIYALPTNVGAAGGFNIGLRIAYDVGADAIWVMDDDVIPEPDALKALLSAGEWLKSKNISVPFVVPLARSPRGIPINVPEIDNRHNALAYPNWPQFLERRLIPVRSAAFTAILIPHETLAQHGLPISAMFIWGEDWEFTQRVTLKQPGYLVGDSKVVHLRETDSTLDIRAESNPTRIGYHFYHARNTTYRLRHFNRRRTIMKHLYNQVSLFAHLCVKGEFEKAKIIALGTFRGLTFNPAIEPADTPFEMRGVRTSTDRPPLCAVT